MSSERILGAGAAWPTGDWPLLRVAQVRELEAQAAARLPAHTLMQRAGLALARLTLALVPHARTIWIACGPGNNGGDGFEAAAHLKAWGKNPVISHLAPVTYSDDAAKSLAKAVAVGVPIGPDAPPAYDACIDALFGIGLQRPLAAEYAQWAQAMHRSGKPLIAADCPSGLDCDTGQAQPLRVQAHATLSFLALKPGLFTHQGRDCCGDIWLDTLQVPAITAPCAWLNPPPSPVARPHASHKGSFGDVAVVGADAGMWGAACLAARAALHQGAGRVYLAPLDARMPLLDGAQPEVMFRAPQSLDTAALSVVAGCGGGSAIGALLPALVAQARHLVLDADALNQLAAQPTLAPALRQRPSDTTVLTPHPLEAARLLGTDTAQVQADRLNAAQTLADHYSATVVLKGSGTIVAAPGQTPRINPTGNARLASGGSGDVLAGIVGAGLAQGQGAFTAASAAVYRHGLAAHHAGAGTASALPASELLRHI